MPSEALKMSYVHSRISEYALAQLSARLREDTALPFTTTKEIPENLDAAFGDANR